MRDEIKNWLNGQHPYLQEATYLILSKGRLDDADINELIEIVKNPDITEGIPPRDYPNITGSNTTKESVRLVSIGEVQGIENLRPRNPLSFQEGNLNVVYGNNGSGKSGYVRILKKASNKSGAKDLKPNVFNNEKYHQQCSITYKKNSDATSIIWEANSEPIQDLQDIDIFDTLSGGFYIDYDNEPSFIPAELRLFPDLAKISDKLSKVLETEKNKLVKQLPILPVKFNNTTAGTIYLSLSTETNKESIELISNWSNEEQNELNELTDLLKTSNPQEIAKKFRESKQQTDILKANLENAISTISLTNCRHIIDLRNLKIAKRIAAKEGAEVITKSKLAGIGSETWRALWSAAREYSINEAYPEIPFPNTEETAYCVLCNQSLDDEAKERLNTFESYITGKLQMDAVTAEKNYLKEINSLPQKPDSSEYLKTACRAAGLTDDLIELLEKAWAEIYRITEQIKTGYQLKDIDKFDGEAHEIVGILTLLSNENEEKASSYGKLTPVTNFQELSRQNLELHARAWTAEQADAIMLEIERLNNVSKYEKWLKILDTTKISNKAGEISENLITVEYISRFNTELENLGAKNISVELVKTRVEKGQNKHMVKLKGLKIPGIKTEDILSEGEKRIVALAAFLADVTGKDTKSAFIFDDPISSLDQIYEEKTIKRLIDLSNDRQVIIFTHRLSFVSLITEMGTPNIIFISKEFWGAGEPGEIPIFAKHPEKALNNLKEFRLNQARKALETGGSGDYNPLCQAICSDFRKIMERIVELKLLADVIQRHRREVKTKNIIENLAKITIKDCKLIEKIMTKYSRYEHSQSDESPVNLPEPGELEKDIEEIINWLNEFSKRTI